VPEPTTLLSGNAIQGANAVEPPSVYSAVIEKKLLTCGTDRNWNTILKLAALAGALDGWTQVKTMTKRTPMIQIVSKRRIERMDLSRFHFLISIHGEPRHAPLRRDFRGRRLDICIAHSGHAGHRAKAEQIERIYRFARGWKRTKKRNLLCQCYYGENRSAAAALVVLLVDSWNPRRAVRKLYEIQPHARPAGYIVDLIERFFKLRKHELHRLLS
jgi:predicted protein tyrosine phosphatase